MRRENLFSLLPSWPVRAIYISSSFKLIKENFPFWICLQKNIMSISPWNAYEKIKVWDLLCIVDGTPLSEDLKRGVEDKSERPSITSKIRIVHLTNCKTKNLSPNLFSLFHGTFGKKEKSLSLEFSSHFFQHLNRWTKAISGSHQITKIFYPRPDDVASEPIF